MFKPKRAPFYLTVYFAIEDGEEIWSLDKSDFDTWKHRGYEGVGAVLYKRIDKLPEGL